MTDLLVELMQINFPVFSMKKDSMDSSDELNSPTLCKEDGMQLTEEQIRMVKVLKTKKTAVVTQLVSMLDHRAKKDTESALNTSSVLIELVEIEKTFELFFANDALLLSKVLQLALDPSNKFHQPYVLQLLL